jgi:hypothetical protein
MVAKGMLCIFLSLCVTLKSLFCHNNIKDYKLLQLLKSLELLKRSKLVFSSGNVEINQ